MKGRWIVGLGFVSASAMRVGADAAKRAPIPTLETERARRSYVIGLSVGASLKRDDQGEDLDLQLLTAGIADQLHGNEPRLKQEQIRETFTKMQADQTALRQKIAVENRHKGEAFLAADLKKPGTQKSESGIQYRILTAVKSGPSPKETDKVRVHYRGQLTDGSEFDSSHKRGEPATFAVSGLIPGWQEVLQRMKKGETWEFAIPPELAYGERGSPGAIPPNSVLVFTMELIDILSEGK